MGKTVVEKSKTKSVVINKLVHPEIINDRELKAIITGMLPSLIPVNAKYRKKRVTLSASVEGLLSLREYFNGIVDRKMFLEVIAQLIIVIKECEKNIMNIKNLLFHVDYIFIDPDTKKVQCIFWPILNNQHPASIAGFFKDLPYRVVFSKDEDNDYVSTYLHYFSSPPPFSIYSFEKVIHELMGKTESKLYMEQQSSTREQNYSETTVLGTEEAGETTVLGFEDEDGTTVLGFQEPTFPYLIRESTQEKVSVNKPSFRIGKEKRYCDLFISDNTAISRSHADILTKDNRYFIIDNNSTNKTYVDGRVIPVREEVEIFSGTKIKLANEEFVFYL